MSSGVSSMSCGTLPPGTPPGVLRRVAISHRGVRASRGKVPGIYATACALAYR